VVRESLLGGRISETMYPKLINEFRKTKRADEVHDTKLLKMKALGRSGGHSGIS